jgi:hypothetical protein
MKRNKCSPGKNAEFTVKRVDSPVNSGDFTCWFQYKKVKKWGFQHEKCRLHLSGALKDLTQSWLCDPQKWGYHPLRWCTVPPAKGEWEFHPSNHEYIYIIYTSILSSTRLMGVVNFLFLPTHTSCLLYSSPTMLGTYSDIVLIMQGIPINPKLGTQSSIQIPFCIP